MTFVWKTDKRNSSNNDDIFHTSFLIFEEQERIIFEQYFETGRISNKNRTNENEKINDNDDSSNSIVAGFPVVNSTGQNSLLFYATGIYASRDHVWTSDAHINQTGRGNHDFCYEPNVQLDNVVAVLSGGPYGIADGLEFVNGTRVHTACRSDGVLIRPRWPLASMDFTFADEDAKGTLIWAARDDVSGSFRWSCIVGVDLSKDVAITPEKLLQGMLSSSPSGMMVAWEVTIGEPVQKIVAFSDSSPFMLPETIKAIGSTLRGRQSSSYSLCNDTCIAQRNGNPWRSLQMGNDVFWSRHGIAS